MDKLKVPVGGVWYGFNARSETGYDVTVTDEIVVREIFIENVYQVGPGDLADTGVVMDIGGNIGAFSIYCAALGAKKVHAFEPDSLNRAMLVSNIAENALGSVITVHPVGVSRDGAPARLVQGQGASFLEGVKGLTPAAARQAKRATREDVETVTLAAAYELAGVANCDILKVDCEGSEYGIFEGATPEIIAKARYITMEFHPADEVTFGRLVAKLTLTHNIHIIGRHDLGGQLYARLY